MLRDVSQLESTCLRDFCRRILEAPDLEAKLAPPSGELDDSRPGPMLQLKRPARACELRMSGGRGALPRPGQLGERTARVRCLARFAHHELMAVELFAWALLRWPELPRELRRALSRVLVQEQEHCRLYLARLRDQGSDLPEHAPHSDYFWKQAPAIAASPHGPRAFLAAVGLTFEQANLDFALLYRDAFREAGDEASARVCQQIHDDEVGHVGLAASWLARLADPKGDLISAYTEAVPFPLSAARAKGRRFDAAGRRSAGLDDAFIEHVRRARSNQETSGPTRRDG
jgi:uncharacterized ferritin-like protein (DUF455 family)